MRILAVDTTERTGTVALLRDHVEVAACSLDADRRSAQTLVARIRDLMHDAKWSMTDVDLCAVSSGPGSFTGLRVGVTAAKVWAYAAGAEVLGVNTLKVIAAAAPPELSPIWAVISAERKQVFAARFLRHDDGLELLDATTVVNRDRWLEQIQPDEAVTGPALNALRDQLPSDVRIAEPDVWPPHARWVGQVAWQEYLAGRRDDLWQLVPQYFRKSAAEEKREVASGGTDCQPS